MTRVEACSLSLYKIVILHGRHIVVSSYYCTVVVLTARIEDLHVVMTLRDNIGVSVAGCTCFT